MTHIVAISPHLDDAAYSVGGFLAARARGGDGVTILTCFTGNVARPGGFALACQLDKGLGLEIDYMALRRAEDRAACAVIGARCAHMPFLEAPHRGYDDAAALFAGRRGDDDTILADLTADIARRLALIDPDLVLGPLGIGDHVDHGLVRDAISSCGYPVLLWRDWPYSRRASEVPGRPPQIRHRLDAQDRRDRLAMCAAYASQTGFQFGDADALARAVAEVAEECLYPPPSHPA